MRNSLFVLAAILISCGTVPIAAASSGLALVGVQDAHGSISAYTGVVKALPGSSLGDGWFLRPWLSMTTYHYHGGPGVVHARVHAFSLGFGRAWSGFLGSLSTSVAPGWQYTDLSPNDPSNPQHGGRAFALLQVQWRTTVAQRWHTALIANYSAGTGDWWTRGRVGYRLSAAKITMGPSLVEQGGPSYRAWQSGFYLSLPVGTRWRVNGASGFRRNVGLPGGAYVSMSVSLTY